MYFLSVHINVFDQVREYTTPVIHGMQKKKKKKNLLLTGFNFSTITNFLKNMKKKFNIEKKKNKFFG